MVGTPLPQVVPPPTSSPRARVRRCAERERLFRRLAKVVVAVSGGADSVAALLLLRELAEEHGFEVVAAHFDHHLRADSGGDRAFVSELCERLDVPCMTGEGDVLLAAGEMGTGIEETARRLRYQFLAFAAERQGAAAVATGHTADDHVETVLHHLVRGSGVRGMRGMLPSAPLPGMPSLRLIRPILSLGRTETVAVCNAAGIDYREDSTNAELHATRNRIRHVVLPQLREENPGADAAILGLAESARELFRSVEQAADLAQPRDRAPGSVVFELEMLRSLGSEARLLLLEREAAFLKAEVDANRTRLRNLDTVLSRGTGQVTFGGVTVEVSAGLVRLSAGSEEEEEPFEEQFVNIPGVTRVGERVLQAATDPFPDDAGAPPAAAVPADRIEGALRLRPLAPGDRMRYRGYRRKVSGILKDARVPVWERHNLVALAGREDVVAVVGKTVAIGDGGEGDDCYCFRLAPPSPPAQPLRVDGG